jgi:hypothetical protein
MGHIRAAGRYIGEHLSSGDCLVLAGDWYDMNSLSSYDKPGDVGWESKDLDEDFAVGREGLAMLADGVDETNHGLWDNLKKHVTKGNHEYRATRVREMAAYRRFGSALDEGRFAFKEYGIKEHEFLHYLKLDGILYSHYFVNPLANSSNPIGGTIHNRLNKLKLSHTCGHTQGLDLGMQYTADGRRIRGLCAGSFYQHDEDYIGPQGNKHYWRGILIKHEVAKGDYDLMEVSLKYLMEKYQ